MSFSDYVDLGETGDAGSALWRLGAYSAVGAGKAHLGFLDLAA